MASEREMAVTSAPSALASWMPSLTSHASPNHRAAASTHKHAAPARRAGFGPENCYMPRPPRPMTATFEPAPMLNWRSGDHIVTPAHIIGPTYLSGYEGGTGVAKRSCTTNLVV